MKKVILLLALLPLMVFGQKCMSDEYNATKTFKTDRSSIADEDVDLESVYVINLVFHIVHKDFGEMNDEVPRSDDFFNDEDVEFAVACLNRDFNLNNADTSILTDTLRLLPGNMKIEFKLAEVDPDGNITNGITRTTTNVDFFSYYNDAVKFDSLGGKDAWDTEKYLNVWVCRTTNGLLGYSQFPGGDAETDGVVVLNDIAKEFPQQYPTFNKGRVLAHEIGHSLSLRHPWGNGWGCSDNLVDDIPTQNGPNRNCIDTTFSICHGDTTRDVVKHYMDYCGDACMVMFTKGQVFNARKSIQQYRMDLVTIKEVEPESIKIGDIKVFPTINTGKLFIEFNNRFVDQNVIFQLYDMKGSLVQTEMLVGGIRNSINLDLHTNGLYSVVLIVGRDIRYKDRIIYTKETYKRIEFDDDLENVIEEEYER